LAFLKCCESLAFLVRDVAHVTPLNFNQCVQALRIFVEASFSGRIQSNSVEDNKLQAENGKNNQESSRSAMKHRTPAFSKPPSSMRKVRSAPHNVRNASTPNSGANSDYDADESDNEDFSREFHHVALQLLGLMHTLHTRAAQIHFSWAEEAEQSAGNNGTSWGANPNNNFVNTSRLWSDAWCPLLQGMARLWQLQY
jgi:brefeldin A-resistance guanine nucleotide exchange factor 1